MTKKFKLTNEKCVYILIIGKPNVGKSTLFNKLIKKKISITSKKKYTTQQNITGIYTRKNHQYIYVDTPGFDLNKYRPSIYILKLINFFNKNFKSKINIILFTIEKKISLYEFKLIQTINKYNIPLLIIINKIDKFKNKKKILPLIQEISNICQNISIIPISSKKINDVNIIKNKIIDRYLFKKKHDFTKNQITNCKNEFIISELIREKTIRLIGDEIPYSIFFLVKYIKKINKKILIHTIIYVKKKNYIRIIIGNKNNKIKKIIFLSKIEINKYLKTKKKIILTINIKYKKNKF